MVQPIIALAATFLISRLTAKNCQGLFYYELIFNATIPCVSQVLFKPVQPQNLVALQSLGEAIKLITFECLGDQDQIVAPALKVLV